MENNKQTLISLAILKTDLDDERRDYFSYLETFVIPILRGWGDEPVVDREIAEEFFKMHGLRIPDRAMQLVLRRLAKKRYLEKSYGVYTVVREIPDNNLSSKKDSARKHIQSIIDSYIEFVREKFQSERSEEEAINALINFLNKFGIDCIRAYVFRSTLPSVGKATHSDEYISGSFIKYIYEFNTSLFESFIVFVKGQMYANALTCPDLESIDKDFKKVTFFLDTPLILNLLYLQGAQEYESVVELIQLVTRLKGKVGVFSHTASELESILKATMDNIENPSATGRVVKEVRKLGFKRGDILLKLESYEEELQKYGIKIIKSPPYEEMSQISETDLQSKISELINYKHPRALEFDVNSIRSIFTLRKSLIPLRLEDSGAVLVTNNDSLASAAYEFGKSHNSAREVSSVITDFSLANIAWLKSPMDAPTLPAIETLAVCYAAIEPEARLWEKYLHELDKLESDGSISADSHAMLRVSELAQSTLMELTLGDETNLRDGTVSVILARVKAGIATEHTEIIEKEKQDHFSTKEQLRMLREHQRTLEIRINRFSQRCADATYIVVLLICSALLYFTALTGSGYLPRQYAAYKNIIANGVILVCISWGVYSSIFGTSVSSTIVIMKRKVARILSAKIEKYLIRS